MKTRGATVRGEYLDCIWEEKNTKVYLFQP